jgi:protein-disulfide isomerase
MARVQQKVRGESAVGQPGAGSNRLLIIGGLALALVLAIGVIAFIGLGTSGPTTVTENVDAEGRFLGATDAPVVIRDFSDFGCPHCRRASEQFVPQIIENYVTTGQVRFEFVPVAVLGQGSQNAGQASLCAEEQGRFWEYHDLLFANQNQLQSARMEDWSRFAREAGMDVGAFQQCLGSGKYRRQVDANTQEMGRIGGTGTPTFLVGQTLVAGPGSYEDLRKVIESELGRAN